MEKAGGCGGQTEVGTWEFASGIQVARCWLANVHTVTFAAVVYEVRGTAMHHLRC